MAQRKKQYVILWKDKERKTHAYVRDEGDHESFAFWLEQEEGVKDVQIIEVEKVHNEHALAILKSYTQQIIPKRRIMNALLNMARHTRIRNCVIRCLQEKGEAFTGEIYEFVNEKQRYGVTMNQLCNILVSDRRTIKIGKVISSGNKGVRIRQQLWGLIHATITEHGCEEKAERRERTIPTH
jgi:hypothetical protein